MSDLAIGGIWLLLLFVLLIAQAFAFGYAGGLMLEPLDDFGVGFALGFFLGPVGLVIAWIKRQNGLLERERSERHRPPAPAARVPQPPAPPPPRPPKEPRRFK